MPKSQNCWSEDLKHMGILWLLTERLGGPIQSLLSWEEYSL